MRKLKLLLLQIPHSGSKTDVDEATIIKESHVKYQGGKKRQKLDDSERIGQKKIKTGVRKNKI